MNRLQIGLLSFSVLLFAVIYFGFDTKPKEIKKIESSRSLAAEALSIDSYIQKAVAALDDAEKSELLLLEQSAETSEGAEKAEALKQLSSFWYRTEQPIIAGYYANDVAELVDTETAWAIAGTTFVICVQRTAEQEVRDYCSKRAIRAFENASSINPEEIQHKVNLAMVYVENPPLENPMKGILNLRELNQKNPDDVTVLQTLGTLSIRTGQFERAKERLERVIELDPNNRKAICDLVGVYQSLGENSLAGEFAARCNQ